MLANTFKNYVSLRLQPREDRYYLIQLIDDPRGHTQFSQTTVRRSPPPDDEPASYTETRITTTDDFRFSLQFAKRIAFATFRFGVIESTGGIGADIHLFDDDLEMNIDIFAFGDNTFPRLRARLAYEVVSRLWVLGGVDDAINETADFFLGAQLRFNDEDLKSILPFVPST
jgi:phospholipid/cholesterol/gamma-HCH transport system substrate-binding protein